MSAIDPNAYQSFPLETEPSELAADAKAWLRTRPGWEDWSDDPTRFDAALIDANAMMAAEVRDVAANVPDGIFRRFGAIAGIYPLEATFATITATVTASDNLGYTLEAGTVFGLRATGDVTYHFAADEDVTILPGATVSAEFTLTAQDEGEGPNELGGAAVELVGPLDRVLPWVQSAQATDVATGGQDAETTGDYMNRLVTEQRLSAPRPILPDDFAEFAKRNTAVFRAVAIDRLIPGVNERQTVTHDSTGGTFTLTWSGQTTGAIQWNAAASAVQSALEGLSNIAPGDVLATGGPLPTLVTVEFTGTLALANQPQMTATGTNLTGGADVVTITTTQAGAVAQDDEDKAVTVYVIDVDGLDPGADIRQAIEDDLTSRREAGFLPAVRAPSYFEVDVVANVKVLPGWDATDVQDRVDDAVREFLSPALHGSVPFSETPLWFYDSTLRLTELVEAINRVDGVWHLTGPGSNGLPTMNGSSADINIAAAAYTQPVVLPTPGDVTITAAV